MQHDITHCNNNNCLVKESCYRYQAHLEAQEKQLDYLTYVTLNESIIDTGENCSIYWPYENRIL